MPAGRVWVVGDNGNKSWEVKTASESEVYYRPIDETGAAKGGWRPGLPPIQSFESLPSSLREVLQIIMSKPDPCVANDE